MSSKPSILVLAAALVLALALAGCRTQRGAAFDADDPAITATLDSMMQITMQAAARADADAVLAGAAGDSALMLVTGDVMLTGFENIRTTFRRTYQGVDHQNQEILERRVRVLSPDVAVYAAVGEGTYTDKAGVTSEPIGLGVTVVFVREDGRWRARHVHQSFVQ